MGNSASMLIIPQFDKNVMPKDGVVLSFIHQFIEQCGGRDKLTNMNTTDVCNHFVKPWTEPYKSSFNDVLRATQHPAYRDKAEVFISHAWSYKFLDLVDILLHHFADRPNIVIWFDLFSNNQHQATSLNYD